MRRNKAVNTDFIRRSDGYECGLFSFCQNEFPCSLQRERVMIKMFQKV